MVGLSNKFRGTSAAGRLGPLRRFTFGIALLRFRHPEPPGSAALLQGELVMAQSWLRKLLKRKSKCPRTGRDPKARRWARLALEPLEDRTLLSVSVVQNGTNN